MAASSPFGSLKQLFRVKILQVLSALERFAPLPLQEGFDNAGLQVGLTEAEVSGALLCLDVTEEIVEEAVARHCNLIVSHHPLIFHKLSRVSNDDYVQRTVWKAIKNDVCIVSMHTNMDNAPGGVNFRIAAKMGLTDVCYFGEIRHYEDVVDGAPRRMDYASGVVGTFVEPLAADDLVALLRTRFEVESVQCNQLLRRPIRKVAICGGAGAFLLPDAIKAGADAFVTGEMRYHEFFGHDQQLQICVIGHYQSERFTAEVFKQVIEQACPGVPCHLTAIDTNPILYL